MVCGDGPFARDLEAAVMKFRSSSPSVAIVWASAFIVALTVGVVARQQAPGLAVTSGRVSIDGTSNIHEYSATTDAVHVVSATVTVDAANPDFVAEIVKPGGLQDFEISVSAASLASGKDGLDKNMHKALKVQAHPEISFRLSRFEPGTNGAVRALGTLKIAGVERQVAFDISLQRTDSTLSVKGSIPLLMTDYGITPPKAMLGMLKTDPKVTVTFEASFTIPPAHLAGNS
jgi:polyisoprenoid-binding protein YceI